MSSRLISALVLFAVLCPVLAPVASAAAPKPEDEEVEYIDALIQSNLPDLAEIVIAQAKKKYPDLGPRIAVLEQKGRLRLGKFDEVQAVLDKMKKGSSEYWALSLEMADAYFARQDKPACAKIYQSFFKSVPKPPPELKTFYVEAAYKWAQMQNMAKDFAGAADTYDGLLEQLDKDADEDMWCTIASDNIDLLIRLATETEDATKSAGYLKRAEKLVDTLLWKRELIIFFGRAVSMKAHITMLRGKLQQAQDLVNDYMPDLADIHQQLLEYDPDGKKGSLRLSPMPQCRYLLAKVLWETAKKEAAKDRPNEDVIKDAILGARVGGARNGAGAFNHAINVYVKYPESTWAPDAGELVEEINALVLKRYKKDLKAAAKISPDQMRKVRQMQFQNANEAYATKDWAKAVKEFSDVLMKYPEGEESCSVVANLADSYLELFKSVPKPKEGEEADPEQENLREEYRMNADAVEGYLAERFSGLKPAIFKLAGDQVLRLAAKEHDMGQLGRSDRLYGFYFRYYRKHYQAAQLALSLGGQAYKDEDYEKAIKYFGLIANAFSNSTYYVESLNMMSVLYGKLGDKKEEVAWLRRFAENAKKPSDKLAAQLRIALMQQKEGFDSFNLEGTNEQHQAEIRNQAARNVIKALKDFRLLSDYAQKAIADKATAKSDKDKFSVYREQALYLEGESWQRLQYPVKKVPEFRKRALEVFEQYVGDYPQGRFAPQALVRIGTIYTALKEIEKSKEAFARLSKDFPDSDEAKNSVPRLAKTLIEMGLKREGVAEYRKMLETRGAYTAGQFYAAGEALREAREWDTASLAYEKAGEMARATTNQQSLVALTLIGSAKALQGAGRLAEAHAALDEFVNDDKYSKSSLVVDAYNLLIDVASEEGRKEKDNDQRRKYFNAAIDAVKKVRRYRPGLEDELALRSTGILVKKMEAEEGMGLKEEAQKTGGLAVAGYLAYLMSHEPNDEHPAAKMSAAELQRLERAYAAVLPLLVKQGAEQAANAIRYGQSYLELFPEGKHATLVQNCINQAKAEGTAAPAAAASEEETAEEAAAAAEEAAALKEAAEEESAAAAEEAPAEESVAEEAPAEEPAEEEVSEE